MMVVTNKTKGSYEPEIDYTSLKMAHFHQPKFDLLTNPT